MWKGNTLVENKPIRHRPKDQDEAAKLGRCGSGAKQRLGSRSDSKPEKGDRATKQSGTLAIQQLSKPLSIQASHERHLGSLFKYVDT